MSLPVLPALLPIPPYPAPLSGHVTLPGSKSLTNRALLLAALCDEPVTLTGALFSEDTHLMAEALRALGFTVTADASSHRVTVAGQGNAFQATQPVELFVGLAGTAARFLTALCAAAPAGVYRLDGIPQMRRRPMQGLITTLRQLGAEIRCTGEEGFFPFEIHARGLCGGPASIDAQASSQMLSALLMVAPRGAADLELTLLGGVRWPFVQMTARLLENFGQPPVQRLAEDRLRATAGRAYHCTGGVYAVEPDASAASYFAALPLVTGGALTLRELRPGLQGDTRFLEVLGRVGLEVEQSEAGYTVRRQEGRTLHGVEADFTEFSDTFLTLAALTPLLTGPTKITGIAHSRKQETDRVAGMARELTRLGQQVIETEDSLEIHPRPLHAGQTIETYGDHRFAMSFGILGCHDLHGDGRPWLTVRDPACCAKTFPEFFEVLADLRARVSTSLQTLPAAPVSPPTALRVLIVAIDGGAASGKSSTARELAERFHLLHVDTGSYYRAVTAELLRQGLTPAALDAVEAALPGLALGTTVTGRLARMTLGGRLPPDAELRTPEVNAAVSHFAAQPALRAALLAYQRGQAEVAQSSGFRGLVMEGRDIGSVIFPDADLRFYLFADLQERARRRAAEGQADSVGERDRLDSTRTAAPLTLPPGATAVDSTYLTLAEVVDKLAAAIATRLGDNPPAA